MLVVFSKIMQSNHIYKEVFNLSESLNQGLARGLLKLLKADNAIITYLGSQALKSIIQFVDASEANAERRNKEIMVSVSKINIMQYITRSLQLNDRYQKLHKGEIKCHIQIKTIVDILQAIICDRKAAQFIHDQLTNELSEMGRSG